MLVEGTLAKQKSQSTWYFFLKVISVISSCHTDVCSSVNFSDKFVFLGCDNKIDSCVCQLVHLQSMALLMTGWMGERAGSQDHRDRHCAVPYARCFDFIVAQWEEVKTCRPSLTVFGFDKQLTSSNYLLGNHHSPNTHISLCCHSKKKKLFPRPTLHHI